MTARWGCFWWRLGQAQLVGVKERWRQEVAGIGVGSTAYMQCDHIGLISLNAYIPVLTRCVHSSPSLTASPSLLLSLPFLPLSFPSLPSAHQMERSASRHVITSFLSPPYILVDLPQNGAGILVTVEVGKCSLPSSQGRVYLIGGHGCRKQGRS